MRPLVVCGMVNAFTGYGQHCLEVVKHLSERREVFVRPIQLSQQFTEVPGWVWKHCLFEPHHHPWELALYHTYHVPNPDKRTAFFTMWETTVLHERARYSLNKCPLVIVPCKWNLECFRSSGVRSPIELVPLGINPDVFSFTPMKMDGPCVFGAAGRLKHGRSRKGVNHVVELFQRAFPKEKDVRLHIKSFSDEGELVVPDDSRIDVTRAFLTDSELARFYAGLTCFVSAARGEGWGLMQHQAMACGRPVIACAYGGLSEFMSEANSYCCKYKEVKADEKYQGFGNWAMPDDDHMIALMRHVYKDREHAKCMGVSAEQDASKLTWRRSNETLEAVLTKHGVI